MFKYTEKRWFYILTRESSMAIGSLCNQYTNVNKVGDWQGFHSSNYWSGYKKLFFIFADFL